MPLPQTWINHFRSFHLRLPDASSEKEAVHAVHGSYADQLIQNSDFIGLPPEKVRAIRERIERHWSEIQAIAAAVSKAQEVSELLRDANAPTISSDLGFSAELENAAYHYAHYLRDNRFTSVQLARFLGIHG